jgi:hypothetical protein
MHERQRAGVHLIVMGTEREHLQLVEEVLVPRPPQQLHQAPLRRLRGEGLSYHAIATRLNDAGHRTREGKPFQAMGVWKILDRAARAARETKR